MKDSDITYRTARPSDLEEIDEVERLCFPGVHAFSPEELFYPLLSGKGLILVAESGGKVIGFISLILPTEDRGNIATIDIHPEHRRQGIGKSLLEKAENSARAQGIKRLSLEVRTSNREAISFYESSGYEKMGCIKDYYLHPHRGTRDAYCMMKRL